MRLTPMRYKNYTWPHNPRVYSIDYERKMAVHKVPFGLYHLQDLGRTRRVMEGEGEFVGADAYSQFGQLANVFYDSGPGPSRQPRRPPPVVPAWAAATIWSGRGTPSGPSPGSMACLWRSWPPKTRRSGTRI